MPRQLNIHVVFVLVVLCFFHPVFLTHNPIVLDENRDKTHSEGTSTEGYGWDDMQTISPADTNELDVAAHLQQFNNTSKHKEEKEETEASSLPPPPPGHLKKLGEHAKPITDEISELDYMIGGKDFYEFFIRKRQPVVFRGTTSDWVATRQWKNESYLLQNYHDVIFDVEMGKVYNKKLNPRRTMSFSEFLSSYKNTSLYLDSPFPQSAMMKDLQLPLMMQCEKLQSTFTSMHFLFSNGGTSCPLHHDGYENFLSLFSGTKVVYAIDPKYGDNLYMQTIEDFPGLSPINPESVDLVKYPKFHGIPFHKIELHAGDILYIPRGWFHQVRSYDTPNIAASMWFQYFTHINTEEFKFRNPLAIEELFSKLVEAAPETIECENQNIKMQTFDKIQLKQIHKQDINRVLNHPKSTTSLINNTVLIEQVRPGEATIFVGSDDRWIYAIDMLTGIIKWKIETAQDTGSTCAFSPDNMTVYCGADDSFIRAMHVATGSLQWVYRTGAAVVSSAVVDKNGSIYIGSLDDHMYALHYNGTLKWVVNLNGPIWSSPALHPEKNIIYISTRRNTPPHSNMYALDKSTGEILWKRFSSTGFVSSPRLNPSSDSVYFLDESGLVYSYNSVDGTLNFAKVAGTEEGCSATPTVDENGILYALLTSGKLISLDTADKKQVWQIDVGNSTIGSNSSPHIGLDGILYVGGGNGSVFAVNRNDGKILWKTDIGTGIFFSSPRLSKDGVVYIGSLDGALYALDSNTGDIIWYTNTDGPLVGTPLITSGF